MGRPVVKAHRAETGEIYLYFNCPGCKISHSVPAQRWNWNGSYDKPTFHPSVKNTWDHGEEHIHHCCHFTLTDGVITFCNDCTHDKKDQTLPLEPISEVEEKLLRAEGFLPDTGNY